MTVMHPSEYLESTYVAPLKLSADELAKLLHVPAVRIRQLLLGDAPMTADLAVRLAVLFDKPAAEWLTLQANFDIAQAERSADLSQLSRYAEMDRLWVTGFPAKEGRYLWREGPGAEEHEVKFDIERCGDRSAGRVLCYTLTSVEYDGYGRGQWRCP